MSLTALRRTAAPVAVLAATAAGLAVAPVTSAHAADGATRAATSPATCPPIPSATTNSRRSSALMKQSSFMRRTGPVSLKPNAFTGFSGGVYHAVRARVILLTW